MRDFSSKSGLPLNNPNNGDIRQRIDEMSASEVAEAFEQLVQNMDEENYDPTLIDAYLDALDQKAPMPEMPSKEESYVSFQQRLVQFAPKNAVKADRPIPQFRRIKSAALVAALSIICMLGIMMVAHAAGINIWGTMASWTDEIFSFGSHHSTGSIGEIDKTSTEHTAYTSLQEALDAYQIAEVGAPTWMPDGYTLNGVNAMYSNAVNQLFICAEYSDGTDLILVTISTYDGEPSWQIEKNTASPESFELNGSIVYLLENNYNNTAAWVTEHLECVVAGNVDKMVLQQIVNSTQDDIRKDVDK